MRGHSQDEGWKLLEDRNIPIVKFGTTEEAVQKTVRLVNPNTRNCGACSGPQGKGA
jgi:hypothetical protein